MISIRNNYKKAFTKLTDPVIKDLKAKQKAKECHDYIEFKLLYSKIRMFLIK